MNVIIEAVIVGIAYSVIGIVVSVYFRKKCNNSIATQDWKSIPNRFKKQYQKKGVHEGQMIKQLESDMRTDFMLSIPKLGSMMFVFGFVIWALIKSM